MGNPKHSPREQGTASQALEEGDRLPAGSFIRSSEDGERVDVPLAPFVPPLGVDGFLEEWAQRHFAVSVRLHDLERVSERDPDAVLVLEDLAFVQGVLLELHDFAASDLRVRALMEATRALQNGVGGVYGWIDDLLDAASQRNVAHGRPGFIDLGDETLPTILGMLEKVHPDLEALVRADALATDADVAHKLSLCFRQIGAVIVRVSGRAVSTLPPR